MDQRYERLKNLGKRKFVSRCGTAGARDQRKRRGACSPRGVEGLDVAVQRRPVCEDTERRGDLDSATRRLHQTYETELTSKNFFGIVRLPRFAVPKKRRRVDTFE